MLFRLNWALMLATLASAFALYAVKYDTRRLEARVQAQERALEKAESDVTVLVAERAHLARPERLEPLARLIGLAPISSTQYVRIGGDVDAAAARLREQVIAMSAILNRSLPPPVSKVSPSAQRRGRTERHGLSSPITTLSTAADGRAKSDGVPRWGCLSRARPITPTRCVQRLSASVDFASLSAMDALSRGRTALPPRRDEGNAFVAGGGDSAASDGASSRRDGGAQ